jgi:hypothetical protein
VPFSTQGKIKTQLQAGVQAGRQMYLILIDAQSKWIKVFSMTTTTTTFFSRYGVLH